ncbi:hypothetical protein BRADI_4g34561v3 [Brachypodium distachyon]|uniref:Uncharacterized protein n=1 Tax=Brachypodium distachyon TaxID=15368 RepID=A0A2K2CS82_BRADI|nr:hypothetical protein BRADI_4g34561v3 [Brachypodium distachyon]
MDEYLRVETFDPEEYIRIAIRQEARAGDLAAGAGPGPNQRDQDVRRQLETERQRDAKFVEVMAPVFSREAWRCVWHLIQNDLDHAWGLDFNFRRCVDIHDQSEISQDPKEQMDIVDAQYIAHHAVKTLFGQVSARQRDEMRIFGDRLASADEKERANSNSLQKSADDHHP